MSEKPSSGHAHLTGLDGLRGIAALAVLGHHLELARRMGAFDHAYLAVDFFFLLSGFVIGLAYEPKFRSGMGFLAYARVRLIRLYPMILAGAFLGAVAAAATGFAPIWPCLPAQILFIPFVLGTEQFPLNGVQWSLLFELLANFVHALAYRLLSNLVLASVVMLSAVWLVAIDHHFGSLDVGYDPGNFVGGLARVACSFGAGLLIFRLGRAGRLPSVRMPWWVVAAALAAALTLPKPSAVPDSAYVLVLFPLLLLLGQASAPVRFAGIAGWLGAISYPLYAIHLSCLRLAELLMPRDGGAVVHGIFWFGALAAPLAAATLFERCYDAPVRRWLTAKARRAAPRRPGLA